MPDANERGADRARDGDGPTDEALVAAVNAGDEQAFDTLYFRHRDWVVAVAFRILGDHAAAMDVLQETFVYFAGKFPGFALTCRLRTFLYPAVKNLALSNLRRTRRFVPEGLDSVPPEEMTAAAPETSADELAAALASLSDEHREILILRFVEGFGMREMAEALGIPEGTVKSRLHHALNQLRRNPAVRNRFGIGK